MLRIKHKDIFMQFIALVVLCLFAGLTMSLWLNPACAAPPPQQPYYVVDAYQTPCVVYRIVNSKPSIFFRRRSGNISSIALWRGQLYFCSANARRIFVKRHRESERVVFTHNTYVRDVAVDPNGNLYFSEASGARGDGRIYKLRPRVNELRPDRRFSISSDSQSRSVQVRLSTVDGFWAGDFTFDARGDLYLSTGNRTPAFIYRLPRDPNGVHARPQKVYRDTKGAIKGLAIDPRNSDFIYYADWGRIVYGLNIRSFRRNVTFSGNVAKSRIPHLSDVALDIRSPRRN